MSTEERPCEDGVRRWPSAILEESSHQEANQPAPWSWTSQPSVRQDINFCCLSHPVYGILLWQPKQTKIPCLFYQESSACCLWWVTSVSYVSLKRVSKRENGLSFRSNPRFRSKVRALFPAHACQKLEVQSGGLPNPFQVSFIQLLVIILGYKILKYPRHHPVFCQTN